MAQDTTKTLVTVGVLGIGGYLIYEYSRYQKALSMIFRNDATQIANAEQQFPFMRYVTLNLGIGTPTTQEAAALAAIQNALSGNVVMPPTPTPGTGPTMTAAQAPVSVSTTPTTTPTTGGSAGGTAAAAPVVQQPTAADLQHSLGMTLATADQWNYAYRQLMGAGIDQVYGFAGLDPVYGAVKNGARSSGRLSAQAFLQAPVIMGYKPVSSVAGMSGLGAIAQFYTPVVRSAGSMIYSAQHPSPYRQPSYNLAGFTQPTGMEMAILGRQTLRGNKII